VNQLTGRQSSSEGQQRHIPGSFDSPFCFSLAASTITAALARINFPTISQKLLQSPYVFVVNIVNASSAKTALRLLAGSDKAGFSSVNDFFCHP
jgi:hypothetical protein